MQSPPLIREGGWNDLATMVDTLADSFASDPVLNWVMPRRALYPEFFRILVRDVYLPRGIVHMETAGRGAALWLPPGERLEIPPQMSMISLVCRQILRHGPKVLWRIHRQGALFAKYHPKEPHYYLQFIGCRQRDQGDGVGATLLKQGTRLCDERGMPAYLESSNERNVPLYQRHGFEVMHHLTLPGNGPKVWFMWREARH